MLGERGAVSAISSKLPAVALQQFDELQVGDGRQMSLCHVLGTNWDALWLHEMGIRQDVILLRGRRLIGRMQGNAVLGKESLAFADAFHGVERKHQQFFQTRAHFIKAIATVRDSQFLTVTNPLPLFLKEP